MPIELGFYIANASEYVFLKAEINLYHFGVM